MSSTTLRAALAVLCLAGCNDSDDRPPATDEAAPPSAEPPASITVYSGRSEQLVGPALTAFESETGIDLEIRYGDTAQLAASLLEEGARSPADVFIAQDGSTLGFLDDRDVFAPAGDEITARVAPGYRSDEGTWVGLSGRARVLAYNTEAVEPDDLPGSVDELTAPRWKGRVGWAPENASFQAFVAAMVELRGAEETEAWLTRMKANEPKSYPSNTPAVQAVGRGEIDVALVNHYYLYRLREELGDSFPVENHYFRSGSAGSLVNLSGGAVLASSDQPEAARRLLAYLLSPEGQAHFVEGNHEFPAARGVESPDELPPIETLEAPDIDPGQLENLEQTVGLLRETGVLE